MTVAAEQLLTHADELLAYARRLTRSAADAEDLVQSAFERALAASGPSDPSRTRAFLFSVLRNLHLDTVRSGAWRAALHAVPVDDASLPPLSADAVERLDARLIERALEVLTAERREVLMLSDIWGFCYDEIATITGVPVGTVRSRLSRARMDLWRLLAVELEERADKRGGLR